MDGLWMDGTGIVNKYSGWRIAFGDVSDIFCVHITSVECDSPNTLKY